ncbi:MAG: butyrate kinase [Spirochaetota bacterium]
MSDSKVAKDNFRILVINPGSTSTRVSIFHNETEVFHSTYTHTLDELKPFKRIIDQAEFRLKFVMDFLLESGTTPQKLNAVIGRGGLLRPLEGGVYRVGESMLDDLISGRYGEHSSNLGAILAWEFAKRTGCAAYIADPVVVDEMDEIARLSGIPEIKRRSIFHALNQKSVAREVAGKLGRHYEDCNFIVTHMGGGISVGAHRKGKVVDVNNALDGDGPFSPERAGGLPSGDLIRMCFSGKYTLEDMLHKISGRGGLVAYRGSNSFRELKEAAASGDSYAQLLYEACAYQVSQEICKHGATLKGEVDRIILTGGLAADETFVSMICERISHLAEVEVIPGEREMVSLASAALRVLRREEKPKEY